MTKLHSPETELPRPKNKYGTATAAAITGMVSTATREAVAAAVAVKTVPRNKRGGIQ